MTQTLDKPCACPTCGQAVTGANDSARAAAMCAGRHVTPRQRRTLELIVQSQRENGYPPTLAELATAMGTSKVTAYEHVHRLALAGVIRLFKHRARGIELARTY